MTVFELHLEIEQKLQEQGSYRHDRIFPEAIDLALNQAQHEILESIVSEEIAGTRVRLRHILPLLERNLFLTCIGNPDETRSVMTRIPSYVRHILNCRAERVTSKSCGTIPSEMITEVTYKAENIPFSEATGTAPYYNNFRIINQASSNLYSAPTQFTNRFSDKNQKYELQNSVEDTFNLPNSNIEAVWNGNLLTLFLKSNPTTVSILYDNKQAVAATPAVAVNRLIYNMTAYRNNTDLVVDHVPARYVDNDQTLHQKIYLNKFTAPKVSEPFFTWTKDLLYIFYAKDSIITNVLIDYIRNPKRISLTLNQTSELDPSAHPELVNRAVEILKQNIQDPSVQGDVQLNQLNSSK